MHLPVSKQAGMLNFTSRFPMPAYKNTMRGAGEHIKAQNKNDKVIIHNTSL